MILENPSWSFILISFEEPSFITNTALGVIFPPTPPPALVSFEKVPTPIPKETSAIGRIIVSPTVIASPTTDFVVINFSIALSKSSVAFLSSDI